MTLPKRWLHAALGFPLFVSWSACMLDFYRYDPPSSGDASDDVTTSDATAADASTDVGAVVPSEASSEQDAAGGCTVDTQCPTIAPYCATTGATTCETTGATTGQCVQCRTKSDCSGATPYCSAIDGGEATCVQCTQNSECGRRTTSMNGKCG